MFKLKTCQIALFWGALISTFWVATAQAGDTANITVTATIVNRTCTTDWTDNTRKTTIALGTVDGTKMTAKGDIGATGETTLGLSGCNGVNKVTVTASGSADSGDASAFANSATGNTAAKGVAVLLKGGTDEGTVLKPDGTTSVVYNVAHNAVNMTFKAFLEGNGNAVTDGAFSAPITLNMAYE
jgi:type 1 fimbria pilin